MKKVKSSHIDSVDYDADSRTLKIKFSNGAIYDYSNVPQSTYMCLNLASSKGEYFAKYIKGKYPVKKASQ